jgi:trigger factor
LFLARGVRWRAPGVRFAETSDCPNIAEGNPTLTPTETHEEQITAGDVSAPMEAQATPDAHSQDGHEHPHDSHEHSHDGHEHSHDGHEHSHDGHEHDGHDHEGHEPHHHEPVLNPELTRSIGVEAPAAEVDKAFKQVIKRYTKLARIPGFRAGKVPESLIKSRFAREVRQEVLDSLVNAKFRQALEEQKINPVSQPQVTEMLLNEGAPLKFTATFEVLPEVNVDGYDSVSVQKPDVTVSEDEYQAELDAVLDHHATVEPVEEDRAIGDGDWAEISYTGLVQDLAQTVGEEGLETKSDEQPVTGEDVLLEVGGKNTLEAFTAALRGAKVGQEMAVEVNYPGEFGDARLAGKTVSYDVTVKAIKKKTLPERDEEFAKQLGPYTDWNDFETKLRERIASRKKDGVEREARDKMLDDIVQKFEFPVPETFVQQQIDARLERGLRALAQQGMSADAMRQLDFGRLRGAQREQAVNEVKASLIMDRIAEREGVDVTDEDVERELLMLSLQSREPLDVLKKRLQEDGSLGRIREQMRREKAGQALFEKLAR